MKTKLAAGALAVLCLASGALGCGDPPASTGGGGAGGAGQGGTGAGDSTGTGTTTGVFPCAAPLADCDGMPGCEVNTSADPLHCGACGAACDTPPGMVASCDNGQCTLACSPGKADCDADPADGCEVDTSADPLHCGACGVACPSHDNTEPLCTAGVCGEVCATGFADCDGIVVNGCETDPLVSQWNCGSCGNQCPFHANAMPSCVGGACVDTCDAGYDDCDGDVANGCEILLPYHPENCGACGVVCPADGGTALCNQGACVVELADLQGDVGDMVVAGGDLYFSTNPYPGVYMMPVAGGVPTKVDTKSGAYLTHDAQNLYWVSGSNPSSIVKMPIGGGAVTPLTTMVSSAFGNHDLATDGVNLYWTEDYQLRTMPVSGGVPTVLVSEKSSSAGPVVAGDDLYWVRYSIDGSEVRAMPKAGGAFVVLASFSGSFEKMTGNGQDLFAAAPGSGESSIVKVSQMGGGVMFATVPKYTYRMVADGSHVYLFQDASPAVGETGYILKVPVGGGAPVTISPVYATSGLMGGIAIDATHVYWAETSSVRRAPK